MKIDFIPSSENIDNQYDLWVDGKLNVVGVEAGEALETISGLLEEAEIIEEFDMVWRAVEMVDLKLPDPQIPLGSCYKLFRIASVVPGSSKFLEVFDRVATDGTSFLLFILFEGSEDNPKWGFFVGRNSKEVGKVVGWKALPPLGELRARILDLFIRKLGRGEIKITL